MEKNKEFVRKEVRDERKQEEKLDIRKIYA